MRSRIQVLLLRRSTKHLEKFIKNSLFFRLFLLLHCGNRALHHLIKIHLNGCWGFPNFLIDKIGVFIYLILDCQRWLFIFLLLLFNIFYTFFNLLFENFHIVFILKYKLHFLPLNKWNSYNISFFIFSFIISILFYNYGHFSCYYISVNLCK